MPLGLAWQMAQAFFGDYLDPGFRGQSHQQEVEIMKNVGLTSVFWTG